MLFALLLYFLLAIGALALVCMPPLRARAAAGAQGLWARGRHLGAGFRASGARRAGERRAARRPGLRRAVASMRRHAVAAALALVILVVLPIGAALLRTLYRADSFDPDATHAVDERVAELLHGEDLVPPPPVPPEFFMTTEVEEWQPLVRSASRQWSLLEATFRQRLLMSFRLLHDRYGYDMVLIEGYRSPDRQAALMALGPSVTRAGPFESHHQFGLAADCAFLHDGHIVISEKDPWAMAAYLRYGEVAKSLGLVWGGDWRSLRDLGHVELHRPGMAPGAGNDRPS